MKTGIQLALATLALLAFAGCDSSSQDNCDKLCSKLVSCASSLDTTVDVLLQQEGVTAGNCAAGCREMAKTECADPTGFFDCVKPLTCPAPGETAIQDVQDEIAVCGDFCSPPM